MVGESKYVAELMTDGADTVQILVRSSLRLQVLNLYAAGIAAKLLAVVTHALPLGNAGKVIGMGPDVLVTVALHIAAITGKNEIHHVDIAIAV